MLKFYTEGEGESLRIIVEQGDKIDTINIPNVDLPPATQPQERFRAITKIMIAEGVVPDTMFVLNN